MRTGWVVPAIVAALVLSSASIATAQYGGQGGAVFPGVPVHGTFQPMAPIDPRSSRAYIDYILNVSMPGTYQIDLVSPNSSAYDPYLYLLQGGRQLEANDDGGGYPNARISRFLPPGTYVVRVSSFRSGPIGPAAFSLTVSGGGGVPTYGGPTYGGPSYGSYSIFPGVPVSGTVMPGLPVDPSSGRAFIDYTLSISAPGTYQIDLMSGNSSAYDPYLYLLQGGMEIDRNDDGGGYPNARVTRFLGPGVYTVRVSSFRSGAIGPAAFTLQVLRR